MKLGLLDKEKEGDDVKDGDEEDQKTVPGLKFCRGESMQFLYRLEPD